MPGGRCHTSPMPRLRKLVFNLFSMDPVQVGGAARLGQALARHLSESTPDEVSCLAGIAHPSWDTFFPLEGRLKVLRAAGLSRLQTAEAVERAFGPLPLSRRASILADHALHRRHRFPRPWQADTIVHVPTQVIHPVPPKHWNLPYVMNLADIQHEHFPEFFTPEQVADRRKHFLSSATAAAAVCVADEWTRRDILCHLPIPPEKVHAIPLAPTWEAKPSAPRALEEVMSGTSEQWPEAFIYYPAQTWAHKNHLRLFEALARLREEGLVVPLLCTGHLNEHYPQLERRLEELDLSRQVRFLGLVSEAAVQALYLAARAVVVPTLFEGGAGIPVLEAMAMGRPLAASKVCGIPEAVGDAGLLFDPMDPADMAGAIRRLWLDRDLATGLGLRGQARMQARSWSRTAAAYLDVYESVLAGAVAGMGR